MFSGSASGALRGVLPGAPRAALVGALRAALRAAFERKCERRVWGGEGTRACVREMCGFWTLASVLSGGLEGAGRLRRFRTSWVRGSTSDPRVNTFRGSSNVNVGCRLP